MIDRYTKVVLSLIACALVYLCIVFTAWPGVHAQQPTLRPGEPSGPVEVLVVGWRPLAGLNSIPVSIVHQVQVTATQPLPIAGAVTTERSSSRPLADRVVLVGWEEMGVRETPGSLQRLSDSATSRNSRLPVTLPK
jgi:hypothetical protein